ncbi:MAG: hypothetical protein J7J78_02425 [Thermoprotei archaeon]|nr:hypothetical protein [Thermoprotei archaeon]
MLNKVAGGRLTVKAKAPETVEAKPTSEGVAQIPQLSPEMREKVGNRPVEVVKLTPQSPQPPPTQIQQTPSTTKAGGEEKKEEKKSQSQAELPPNVVEKINMLESEINKIKKYVKASIDGIKATLVDLRSAMAELSNPFNILRKYADLFSGTEQQQQQTQQPAQNPTQVATVVQPSIQPVIPVIQYPIVQPMQQQNAENKSAEEEPKKEVIQEKEERKENARIDYGLYVKLAQWVNKIIDQIPPDMLEKLVDNYIDIGVIDENIGKALKKIIKTVNELRSLGLSIDEQAKYLRELVHAIGLSNGEVAEKVLPATEKAEESAAKDLLDLIDKG